MKYIIKRWALVLLIGLAVPLGACTEKPAAQKERHKVNTAKQDLNKVPEPAGTPFYASDTIANPDTALAYFIFERHSDFLPLEQQEEYQRIDLQYQKIMLLFTALFGKEPRFDEMLTAVNANRKAFVDTLRSAVQYELKAYHGLSGMSFDFLVRRQDSIVPLLIKQALTDSLLPSAERQYIEALIAEQRIDTTGFK